MAQPLQKNRIRYCVEKLNLLCEWENCAVIESDIEIFLSHIINEHLTKLDPGDLHCHWKDCEGFTDNLSEFRRHILLHAFHSKIKCYGANLQARRMLPNCSSSIQNRNLVPELPEPLLCCWFECAMIYECPEHFYRHVDGHSEFDSQKDGTSICLWQDCNRTFADHFKVKEHLRSHTQEKLVACPTCGGMFSSRTKFLDHIQRQQAVDEGKADAYACEYCPRKMNSERLLRDHMRHHVNHYKCPYCDMTCPTPSGISTHIAYRHSKDKPHACQYCDYKSKTESDLRTHLESHSMVPAYECPVENCSYASRSQTCFRVHYRKEHEGKNPVKYSCHLCEKVFSRGNYLTKHLLNHHKFRWPSGHCRFRYCLNEEGVYRLQTVRYESLELSQEMMGESSEMIAENSENVDDPEAVVNASNQSDQCINSISNNNISESHVPANHINPNANHSVVLSVQEGNGIENQEGSPIVYVPYVNLPGGQAPSEEPVLIKILDVNDSTLGDYSDQNLLLTNLEDLEKSELSAVQSITKDSKGYMVFQTIELVTEAEPTHTS